MGLINYIKRWRINLYIAYCRLLPIQKNKLIFWANSFKQYGCSPKYITEYLLNNFPNQFDIVWVFENGVDLPDSLPDSIRVVRYFSIDYLKELHTARFVICNMRTGDSYLWHKRKGQKYIQTWHSSLRLKKIEKDADNTLPESYIKCAIADSAKIDLLISGCEFSTKIFTESFWYNGKILKCGTPRCDLFFTDTSSIKQKVCNALKIDESYRLFLYAPTFRNDMKASFHDLDFTAIKTALVDKFGGKWIIVYRFHPNIISSYSFDQHGVDATHYPDMQELIAASDILVTDYSSCMFDMALAGKSCWLYTPDIDNYVNKERGLYFNPHDLPFPAATTNEDFIKLIMTFDAERYRTEINKFMENVGSYETGHASGQISNYIFQNLLW